MGESGEELWASSITNEYCRKGGEFMKHTRLRGRTVFCLIAISFVLSSFAARSANATDWPTRPVRFIVTLGAGSGVDIGARLFADKLSALWHQPVVVENRPGGDGILAITSFLGAHDDHTFLVCPVSSFTAHPYFHDTLPYDPKDLIPVARVSKTVVAVAVPVSLGVNSLKDLETLARKQPGKLNWTTATGFTDFVFAGYLHTVGLKMEKVPYKNPAGAATDLAAGTIQVYMPAYAIVRPQVMAGKVKVLAITNRQHFSALADIPTAKEAGYPSLDFDGLVGIFAAPETGGDIRDKIAKDVEAVAKHPTILERMTATGQIVSAGNGTEFAKSIAEQKAQVEAVAKLFGGKPVQ